MRGKAAITRSVSTPNPETTSVARPLDAGAVAGRGAEEAGRTSISVGLPLDATNAKRGDV